MQDSLYTIEIIWALIAISLLDRCTAIPVDERAELRDEINKDVDETLFNMVAAHPEFQKRIDASAGYYVIRFSATKIPVVGAGFGIGILYDKENNSKTYMNVIRTDIGAGLGAGKYRAIVLFENREVLEEFRAGVWKFGAGAESAVSTSVSGSSVTSGSGYSVYFMSDSGAALTESVRLVKLSVNNDLTDVGVSELGIPNTGFTSVDDQGEYAPRVWNYILPFMAQAVIDEGYDGYK